LRSIAAVSNHKEVNSGISANDKPDHFFFVKDADKSEARLKESNAEIASFKDNPVLIALSENRLPDVKPNYEYFSQILNMDSQVIMRPKTTWIYVSSTDVTLDEAEGKAYDRSGKEIDPETYPHLEKNLKKEAGGLGPQGVARSGVILHEYNSDLTQKESAAMTEIAQEWEARFPNLYDGLELATADNLWLDMLEMTVTLELHPRSNFPSGSELNGMVELSIHQPQLQNHRWKCITRLQRPEELCQGADEQTFVEQTSEVGVQYMHRPGCGGAGMGGEGRGGVECDCRTRPKQDVRVPFPAAEWASILSSCAGYLQEPADVKGGRDGEDAKAAEEAAIDCERSAAEAISQIAMFQELWSSPPDNGSNNMNGTADRAGRKWTRRGVILWKFRTVHAFDDKMNPIYEKPTATKGRKPADGEDGMPSGPGGGSSSRRGGNRPKRVYHPPGTTWRFLTALDPISPEHQSNVCVNPATQHHQQQQQHHQHNLGMHRDMLLTPSPHYSHHHFGTPMSDGLGSAWDPVGLPSSGSLGLMNDYSGLATPPPTASLHSSYAPSFDGNHDHHQPSQQQQQGSQQQAPQAQHQIDFLAACTSSMDSQSTLVTDASADPFLSATGGINVGSSMTTVDAYDDADFSGGSSQGWDATTATASFGGLDQWNAWDENKGAATGGTPQSQHQQHHHQQQQQQWHHDAPRWPSAAGDGKDATQIWTPQPTWGAASAASQVPSLTASSGWGDMDNQQGQSHLRVLPSLNQITPLKGLTGSRKRARSNSLDMENRENFPATAIQKIVHHGSGLLDDGQGHHHRWD
jgi:transcriptional enhancer factor